MFFQETVRPAGYEIKPHEHSCDEFVYYESGSGVLTMGAERTHYAAGTWSFLPQGVIHGEMPQEDTRVAFIGFTGASKRLAQGLHCDPNGRMLFYLRRIMEQAKEQPIFFKEQTALLLSALEIEMYRCEKRQSGQRSLTFAIAYLQENYGQPIRIASLAQLCGWHYDHFQHSFKKEVGLSPQQYLIQWRLEKAREMLLAGQSCTLAAYSCGFSNAAQFSTMFKRTYGILPSELRKIRTKADLYKK